MRVKEDRLRALCTQQHRQEAQTKAFPNVQQSIDQFTLSHKGIIKGMRARMSINSFPLNHFERIPNGPRWEHHQIIWFLEHNRKSKLKPKVLEYGPPSLYFNCSLAKDSCYYLFLTLMPAELPTGIFEMTSWWFSWGSWWGWWTGRWQTAQPGACCGRNSTRRCQTPSLAPTTSPCSGQRGSSVGSAPVQSAPSLTRLLTNSIFTGCV